MIYKGEQLLWGQLGHFFVVLAVVTAIFSVIANYCRTKDLSGNDGWKITARGLYLTHAFAVFGIFFTLLLMVFNHRFEYQYVWQHSKRDMSMNYILACIWEGQEGSTLLWLIWHSVIGLILMRRAKDWEAPVMTVLSLVQVFLSVMLLGLYFGKVHIGSNPFELIRLKEENIGLPWTKLADYLTNKNTAVYHDGRGLNPLLQNYWMTIHPPTLFFGFALCTVPFAFAIAGLWTKRYHDWQKPALPWAFTGVLILGTGILMGGAWAYESLSFGGFWAWDPVENASLVPWLVLVGAAHVMLLYRNKGQSLFTTFFLCITAFLLIVYSTFLTKSGILSDTSVHAFTDDGLNEELTAFMGFFLWLSVCLLSFNRNLKIIYTGVAAFVLVEFLRGHHGSSMLLLFVASLLTIIIGYNRFFPKEKKEEELWSREFWMFIGSLILLVASFQIIFYTSAPVVNKFLQVAPVHDFSNWLSTKTGWGWAQKLSEAKIAPDKDSIFFYNRWQVPFAFLITILVAITQYFKYLKTGMAEFRKQIRIPFIVSILITIPLIFSIYFNDEYSGLSGKKQYMYITCSFLLFGAIFAIAANFNYWLRVFKGKIKSAGSSIAHVGFGILLLGVVISTSKKDTISRNSSRFDIKSLSSEGSNEENIYLRKGDTLPMGKYLVTYTHHDRKYKNGTPYVYYHVDFLQKDADGKIEKNFSLAPFFQINKFMGNAAEPDTKHYLHKDIYTFVKFPEMSTLQDTNTISKTDGELFEKPENHTIVKGDTIGMDNCIAVYKGFAMIDSTERSLLKPNEFGVAAHFDVFDQNMNKSELIARYFLDTLSNTERQMDGMDENLGIKFTFWKIHPESNPNSNKIDVFTTIKVSKKADFIVLEAAIFPGINILWIGCLIMMTGTFLAIRDRIKKNKITSTKESSKEVE